MKLIKQTCLFFKQGNSDKVYEVDLCEVGNGEYIVNFRYGRRGANLKDGTKTVFPVPLAEAEKVFEQLVTSKTKKGYTEDADFVHEVETVKSKSSSSNDRETTILKYLAAICKGDHDEEHWTSTRILWKVGELRILEAEKHLIKLQLREDKMFNYCLVWALGRCGGKAALIQLQELLPKLQDSPNVERLCKFGIAILGSDDDTKDLLLEALNRLPANIKSAVETNNEKELIKQLNELLFQLKISNISFLLDLYFVLVCQRKYLEAFRSVLAKVPMRAKYFKSARAIFKVAEFLSDYKTYGLLSKLIERDPAYFSAPKWSNRVYAHNEYFGDYRKELQSEESKLAFSNKTKAYFRRRINRNLRNLGDAKSDNYCRMATGYLMHFGNADSQGITHTSSWFYNTQTRRYDTLHIYYPEYSQYNLFCSIIYGNSSEIEHAGASGWRYRQGKNSTSDDSVRTEAHPELWDQNCEELVFLLIESKCDVVLNFAYKAFIANPKKEEFYSVELCESLMRSSLAKCTDLGIELAQKLLSQAEGKSTIVLAALNSPFDNIRTLGLDWATQYKDQLSQSKEFILGICVNPYSEVHEWLNQHITVPAELEQEISFAIIQFIEETDQKTITDETFELIIKSLVAKFQKSLSQIDHSIIEKLIVSSRPELRVLGSKLLLNHEKGVEGIPDSLFEQLIADESAGVRQIGVELFGKMSLASLKEKKDVVVSFALSQYDEIRQASQSILDRLIEEDQEFKEGVSRIFLEVIKEKEKYDGVHANLLAYFRGSLNDTLSAISEDETWSLLDAFPTASNELVLLILQAKNNVNSLSVKEWVKLGSNEMVDLRQMCFEQFNSNLAKIKYETYDAVKLLDARWEDSKQFARAYFDEHFSKTEWTPDLLISLCDSVYIDTQDYGKKKITEFFDQSDGVRYLLKLSEHPNTNLQLFTSNYVERYASDNVERIKKLEYFFTAALSQINKGRTVKTRLFAFLKKEAFNSLEVAEWLLPILARLSLTIAIEDKAICIQLLLEIKKKYPHLESPIEIEEPELR